MPGPPSSSAPKRKREPAPPSPSPPLPPPPSSASQPPQPAAPPRADGDAVHNPLLYRRRKRVPNRARGSAHDVFVTRDARFAALRARIIALLERNAGPVTLHALGAAITRACDLATEVQRRGGVDTAVNTGTVVVYDDFEPLAPGLPLVTRTRSKSAIYITLTRNSEYV